MPSQWWKWERVWSNYENECFVQILIFLYLWKQYNHIWIIKKAISQSTNNVVDDINLTNSGWEEYFIQCKSSLDSSEQKDVINQFYEQFTMGNTANLVLLTKDKRDSLDQLVKQSKHCLDENVFFEYLNSSDSDFYKQKLEYAIIQRIFYYFRREEPPPHIVSVRRNTKGFGNISNIYLHDIFLFLRQIKILNKFDKSHVINTIEDNTNLDKIWADQLYDIIYTKAVSEWNLALIVEKVHIDKLLEERNINLQIYNKNSFGEEGLSPISNT